jgi:hypothetical protein
MKCEVCELNRSGAREVQPYSGPKPIIEESMCGVKNYPLPIIIYTNKNNNFIGFLLSRISLLKVNNNIINIDVIKRK